MLRIVLASVGLVCGVVAAAPAAEPPPWHRYVLLVEVSEYAKETGFIAPKVTEAAGAKLASVLTTIPAERTTVIRLSEAAARAGTGKMPTAANIRAALAGLLATNPDDDVVLHFACAGFESPDGPALCPAEANLDRPDSMILTREVVEYLRKLPARRRMCLFEACREQRDIKVPKLAPPAGPAEVTSTRPANLRKPGALLVINAASAGQYAMADMVTGQGLMTSQFVSGLTRDADLSKDGQVNWNELMEYLISTVPDAAQERFKVQQDPETMAEGAMGWTLAFCKPEDKVASIPPGRRLSKDPATGYLEEVPAGAPNPPGRMIYLDNNDGTLTPWTPPAAPAAPVNPDYRTSYPAASVGQGGGGRGMSGDRPIAEAAARAGINYGLGVAAGQDPRNWRTAVPPAVQPFIPNGGGNYGRQVMGQVRGRIGW